MSGNGKTTRFDDFRRIRTFGIAGHSWHGGDMRVLVHLQIPDESGLPTNPGRYELVCREVYDYAIRPVHPSTLMGGPEIEAYCGPAHPRLWQLTRRYCGLHVAGPVADAYAAAAAIHAAHADTAPEIPLDTSPARIAGGLGVGGGHVVSGPEPLVEAYVAALARIGVAASCKVIYPHGQFIPYSDGEMYDPPRSFRLLILDQSWVIAESFGLEEMS